MKNLVLAKFPDLTVRKDNNYPKLFVMLNENGELFNESLSTYSAKQTWKIAHDLMIRNELNPNCKEDHLKSMKETHDLIIEAKNDPDYDKSILSDIEIDNLIDNVLKKHNYFSK